MRRIALRRVLAVLLSLALLVPAPMLAPALAQQPAQPPGTLTAPPSLPALPPGIPADAVQRALSQLGLAPGGGQGVPQMMPGQAVAPLPAGQPESTQIRQPQPGDPLSEIERFFNERLPAAQPRVRQYGYETLTAFGAALPQAGGVLSDDYVLGPGDQIAFTFRGRVRNAVTATVDRDGRITLPDIAPVPASGRPLRDFRADVETRVARELPGTDVFLTIANVRQISVFVGGEVNRPGLHQTTSLSSLLDALALAGGIKRTGSLRNLQVISGRTSRTVDLYTVLIGGPAPDLNLLAGDRILVPAVGATLAIVGDVARPGIYEMAPGATSPSLTELVNVAGGAMRPAGNRYTLYDYDAAGRRTLTEIPLVRPMRRGDLVVVGPAASATVGQVRLAGHVVNPELRARGSAGTLRRLIGDPRTIRPDPYSRMIVLARVNPVSRDRSFRGFDLAAVLAGRVDERLRDEDELLVLSVQDVAFLSGPLVQKALTGVVPTITPQAPQAAAVPVGPLPAPILATLPAGIAPSATAGDECPALVQLALMTQQSPQRFTNAMGFPFSETALASCPPLFREFPDLLGFLLDNSIALTGEVARPGLYPVLPGVGLDSLVSAAGGFTRTADLASIELSRQPFEGSGGTLQPLERRTLDVRSGNLAAIRLSPRDTIRVPRAFSDRDIGPVRLAGEVVRPGTYDIRRGERLSELLARAGGLTPQAYAFGAVFTRESARVRQQDGFQRAAREVETALMTLMASQAQPGMQPAGGRGGDIGEAVRAGRELAQGLRTAPAAGRMVIEANPAMLVGRPELDILLEPGDLLVIPKRPSDVAVVGSVLNPGALQFITGTTARDYVRQAGGTARFADPSRAFIVLPNGTARPAGLSGWNLSSEPIPPGSLIVVPQDPAPYETWGMIRDLTGVFTQVAISAAALAVIAREN